MSSKNKEKLLKLFQKAMLEIRFQSENEDGDIRIIRALSDLFHNVPLALLKEDYDATFESVMEKASYNTWLKGWVDANLKIS